MNRDNVVYGVCPTVPCKNRRLDLVSLACKRRLGNEMGDLPARTVVTCDAAGLSAYCSVCGAASTKHCACCKTVGYCSTTCQRAGWKSHKRECPHLADQQALWTPSSSTEDGSTVWVWRAR